MCQLLESIRWENGQYYNLDLHQARMTRAVKANFGTHVFFDLEKNIPVPKGIKKGRYKCRIIYDTQIHRVVFSIYERKKINAIKLVVDEKIAYSHKFENRDCINRHTKNLNEGEEIIFVKKGMLRDASYSNIALYNGAEWHTPTYPLLKGTKRAELLKTGIIFLKKITVHDLKKYERISFINALNDLGELTLDL